jgi:polyisoprenoid-binding protein YceI
MRHSVPTAFIGQRLQFAPLFARGTAFAACLTACLYIAPVHADAYVIDKTATYIGFSWSHLGLTRQQGRFNDFSGSVVFDPRKPNEGTVEVSINTGSVQTGVDALDKHLRTQDFFDTANHKSMVFKSTSAETTGEKTGLITGELTILGITNPVVLDVTWNFTGEHPLGAVNSSFKDKTVSAFSARALIKRSDWGMTRAAPLMSDEIEITIEAEAIKKAN